MDYIVCIKMLVRIEKYETNISLKSFLLLCNFYFLAQICFSSNRIFRIVLFNIDKTIKLYDLKKIVINIVV